MNSDNISVTTQPTVETPPESASNSAPNDQSPKLSEFLSSDSPLLALLKQNPNVFTTMEEALQHSTKLRAMRTSPQSLRASLVSDSEKLSRKRPKKATKQQQSLEDAVAEALKAAGLPPL